MNKQLVIIIAMALGLTALTSYYIININKTPSAMTFDPFKPSAEEKKELAQEMFTAFMVAKQTLPNVLRELTTMEKDKSLDPKKLAMAQDVTKVMKVMDIIARGDIDALKKMPAQDLTFASGQFIVPGNAFKDNLDGKIQHRLYAGENALVFVLFHSSMNSNPAEDLNTLNMLSVLFDKKLNPNIQGGRAVFVKEGDRLTPFESVMNLQQIVELYSFPEAQKMVADYTANYGK